MTARRRVLVTGLGMVTPLGVGVEENWRRALAGESGIRELTAPWQRGCPIHAAGTVAEKDWEGILAALPASAAEEGERRTVFALHAAAQALTDAGFDARQGQRWGVALGAGLGVVRLEDIARWLRPNGRFDDEAFLAAYSTVSPDSIVRNPADRAAAQVARRFGLTGVNATVTTACASATHAIATALRLIQRGDADAVLAGGADSMIHPVGLVCLVLLGAASTSRGSTADLCRPFDRRRSGTVIGEGAGLAVLEEAEHAARRGARAYAEVSGSGSSLDAHHVVAPDPTGAGAARAMKSALADSGLPPDAIDHINAHGTGTHLNDVAEAAAIHKAFGLQARHVAVTSSKSLTGHLLAGCGGPEFVFTALSVARDIVHPTANLTHLDSRCDLDVVAGSARHLEVRAAMSNSFGFGGQNASVVLQKPGSNGGNRA